MLLYPIDFLKSSHLTWNSRSTQVFPIIAFEVLKKSFEQEVRLLFQSTWMFENLHRQMGVKAGKNEFSIAFSWFNLFCSQLGTLCRTLFSTIYYYYYYSDMKGSLWKKKHRLSWIWLLLWKHVNGRRIDSIASTVTKLRQGVVSCDSLKSKIREAPQQQMTQGG